MPPKVSLKGDLMMITLKNFNPNRNFFGKLSDMIPKSLWESDQFSGENSILIVFLFTSTKGT